MNVHKAFLEIDLRLRIRFSWVKLRETNPIVVPQVRLILREVAFLASANGL
jgi:hypothetical protein